jgi:hypothetical protein
MFTILKQYLKHEIARLIYDFLRTRYDVEHWTRTTPCFSCGKPIVADGRFCTYCGWAVTSSPQNIPGRVSSTGSAFNSYRGLKPINVEPVTIILPKHTTRRHFLNYVRTQRDHAGPATLAHRSFQDIEQRG